MRKFFIYLFFIIILIFPVIVFARVGVGIGTGKIQVDQPLKPGGIYDIPPLSVLNTGDELGDYGVTIEYNEKQPQLWPAREWFHFQPASFSLEPGQAQTVNIELSLPLKTEPGDYFAYLEAHPVKTAVPGVTSIGVAAAAKLYFTVAPANIWQAIYYRVKFIFDTYSPWSWVVLAVILAAIIILITRKYFSLQIGVKRKK